MSLDLATNMQLCGKRGPLLAKYKVGFKNKIANSRHCCGSTELCMMTIFTAVIHILTPELLSFTKEFDIWKSQKKTAHGQKAQF